MIRTTARLTARQDSCADATRRHADLHAPALGGLSAISDAAGIPGRSPRGSSWRSPPRVRPHRVRRSTGCSALSRLFTIVLAVFSFVGVAVRMWFGYDVQMKIEQERYRLRKAELDALEVAGRPRRSGPSTAAEAAQAQALLASTSGPWPSARTPGPEGVMSAATTPGLHAVYDEAPRSSRFSSGT